MNSSKEFIRKNALTQRIEMSKAEVETKSIQITNIFFNSFDIQIFKSIHLFLPISKKNEINTVHIIEKLRTDFKHCDIIIPKIISGSNDMKALKLEGDTTFIENKWGIPEPVNASIYPTEKISAMLIPLLAFDLKGNRVGYGKGFYDKFISQCAPSCVKIGLSLSEPLNQIDAETHDQPLDFAITPLELYTFKK